MITIDKQYIVPGEIPSAAVLRRCFKLHKAQLERLDKLYNYLDGEHKIKERKMKSKYAANNKLVCNHAEYITDMAVGYVHGSPVQYSGDESVDELNDLFTDIDEDSHNAELGTDISTFGFGLEYVYMSDDDVPTPKLAVIDPRCGFLVCDTGIEHTPLMGVTFSPRTNLDGIVNGYEISVCTAEYLLEFYSAGSGFDSFELTDDAKINPFQKVNLIEYKNNKREKGDFEGVISLIDAYNLLQSDRVNDKQQLVDALLAISGMSLGDDTNEVGETAKLIKEERILQLDKDGKAEWVVKQLNESEVEVLKKSIKDDIHEFSKVPCLTDENFANNSSGVAMKYKLLGFEELGKTKERYFKQGLRKRLTLIANISAIKGKQLDVSAVDIVMKRSLPVDEELQARIAQETDGFISWETRLKRYDAELDADSEREKLQDERTESAEIQRATFGGFSNTPDGDEEDEE